MYRVAAISRTAAAVVAKVHNRDRSETSARPMANPRTKPEAWAMFPTVQTAVSVVAKHKKNHTTNPLIVRLCGAMKTVAAGGGRTLVPKTPIPSVGHFAVFADPDGIGVGLFQR